MVRASKPKISRKLDVWSINSILRQTRQLLRRGRLCNFALVKMAYMSMSLHAVNHRLTNVPVKQLPHLASCLASSISNCGELLSTPQSQKLGKTDSDNAVQIHKLITRLGSLLQDRTYEGRWTAVVLVKALVEAGQWEILRSSEPFVRGLISILAVRCPIGDILHDRCLLNCCA